MRNSGLYCLSLDKHCPEVRQGLWEDPWSLLTQALQPIVIQQTTPFCTLGTQSNRSQKKKERPILDLVILVAKTENKGGAIVGRGLGPRCSWNS